MQFSDSCKRSKSFFFLCWRTGIVDLWPSLLTTKRFLLLQPTKFTKNHELVLTRSICHVYTAKNCTSNSVPLTSKAGSIQSWGGAAGRKSWRKLTKQVLWRLTTNNPATSRGQSPPRSRADGSPGTYRFGPEAASRCCVPGQLSSGLARS